MKYIGDWRDGIAYGKGKIIYSNGNVYEGSIVNRKANGHGVYTNV